MSTPNPQQPIDDPAPTKRTAAAHNSDQAKGHSISTPLSPDRPSLQQPKEAPLSIERTAAASNDRHANVPTSPKAASRDGASSDPQQQGQDVGATHEMDALLLWDPVLQTLADGLNDIESTRIAQANRYRILTTTKPDEDGEVRGFGLAEDHPAVVALSAQLKTLEFLDKQMSKALEKQLRAHPLYPMVARTKGLGDKTIARLLAAIRDPYWNDLHDRPRTVGELFAFCGVAGPGFRRQRGVKTNWNPDARKRLWIIATTIVKVGGPYRHVYDAGREKYAEKTHTTPCAMCGKKGQPATEGSEWRDGHKHAGAIRLVMRAVLRDLWTESRAIYDAQGPS